MHTFRDAKIMAKALRQSLAEREIEITHSDSLELVARQFGLPDWNTLSARILAVDASPLPLPDGWFVSHPNPAFYTLGQDPTEPGCASIAAVPGADIPPNQTGVLMQSILADPYRGQKLRLSAELRAENAGLGTIWMRIDPQTGRYLRFDNLTTRATDGAISGATGWIERSIVLDVPQAAESIHFGFLLKGSGKLLARNFRLDPTDPDAETTGTNGFLPGPKNLDFGAQDN